MPPLRARVAVACLPATTLSRGGPAAATPCPGQIGTLRVPQGETLRRLVLPATLLSVAGVLLYGFGRAPCVLALIFRVPCPSCGLTRAARFAMHGQLADATHAHPIWFIVIPFVLWAFGYEMYNYVQTGHLGAVEKMRYAKPVTTALLTLLIGLWIARFFGAFGGPVLVSP